MYKYAQEGIMPILPRKKLCRTIFNELSSNEVRLEGNTFFWRIMTLRDCHQLQKKERE